MVIGHGQFDPIGWWDGYRTEDPGTGHLRNGLGCRRYGCGTKILSLTHLGNRPGCSQGRLACRGGGNGLGHSQCDVLPHDTGGGGVTYDPGLVRSDLPLDDAGGAVVGPGLLTLGTGGAIGSNRWGGGREGDSWEIGGLGIDGGL